jgi:hypothetical protein
VEWSKGQESVELIFSRNRKREKGVYRTLETQSETSRGRGVSKASRVEYRWVVAGTGS